MRSYLAAAPSSETAKDAAEGMMAQAFGVFDAAAESVLKGFASKLGCDLANSASYLRRRDEGYFRVAYPAIVNYMVWLDRAGQKEVLQHMDKVFASYMFGVAGYVILDSNLDQGKENPVEILLSVSFVQEQERLILEAFDWSPGAFGLVNRFKQMYLTAELKEKQSRFVRSPYTKEHPEECGYKAVHGYLPYALLLQRSGRADLIDSYLQFFYEWGAPLQIMDDLVDLEDDIKNGHYSYPTLGYERELATMEPAEAANTIRSDRRHVKAIYETCMGLIQSSRKKSVLIGADLMGFFVDILQARLETFFSETFHVHES